MESQQHLGQVPRNRVIFLGTLRSWETPNVSPPRCSQPRRVEPKSKISPSLALAPVAPPAAMKLSSCALAALGLIALASLARAQGQCPITAKVRSRRVAPRCSAEPLRSAARPLRGRLDRSAEARPEAPSSLTLTPSRPAGPRGHRLQARRGGLQLNRPCAQRRPVRRLRRGALQAPRPAPRAARLQLRRCGGP
jgi:hypothetical protein